MEAIKILEEAGKITLSDYRLSLDTNWNNHILLTAIEELISGYKNLEENYRLLKQDMEENYKPITKEEQIYG